MAGMAALVVSIFLSLALFCAPAHAVKKVSSGPTLISTFPSRQQLFSKARTIDCKGSRVESFGNHCSSRGKNPGCKDPNDVCYVKSGTHSQCRPVDRTLPMCWTTIEVVKCKGDSLPKIPPGPMKGRGCETSPSKLHKQTHTKSKGTKAHDHGKDHASPAHGAKEGKNCKASDMAKGCRCAGRFWRCADRSDLITQACDIGLECVRKNEFYAVCSTPARKKWAVNVAGWEGTALPCGVNVGTFGFSASASASPGGFAIASGSSSSGGGGGKAKSGGGKKHSKKKSSKKKSSKKKSSKKKSSKKKSSKKKSSKKKSGGKKKKHGKKH
eukprot:jgi/Ulvmu1/6589/UM003_0226.1